MEGIAPGQGVVFNTVVFWTSVRPVVSVSGTLYSLLVIVGKVKARSLAVGESLFLATFSKGKVLRHPWSQFRAQL